MIADNTGTIKLILWEHSIEQVECGKTYKFKGLKVRVFNDVKFLNTNQSTIIDTADEEIKDINLSSEDISDSIVEGHRVGFKIKIAKSCIVCNNTLYDDDVKNAKITCLSCSTTMLSSVCKTKYVCTLKMMLANGKLPSYTFQ